MLIRAIYENIFWIENWLEILFFDIFQLIIYKEFRRVWLLDFCNTTFVDIIHILWIISI